MEEKIMSSDSDGQLTFADEYALNEYLDEERRRIDRCTDLLARDKMLLNLGMFCERHHLERDATSCYTTIVHDVFKTKKGSEHYDICLQAFRRLGILEFSPDECTWELASQTVAELRQYFV